MRRLLPLALVLLAFPACSSSDDDSTGTGGGGGTPSAGRSGGSASGSAGMATGGSAGSATGGGAGQATGGTSNAGTTGGGAAGMAASKDAPTDTSAEGIKAFLDALDYRSATWASGTTAPAEPDASSFSPHGLVQIWYNKALRQTHADGKEGSASPTGTMAVKELYTGATVVGHAAMLKTDTSWIYYCTASEAGRCYPAQMPGQIIYQTTITNCACHGAGTIASSTMIPPP